MPDMEVEDPAGDARVLVLGWGSTYGPIGAACRGVRRAGCPSPRRTCGTWPRAVQPRRDPAPYERVVVPEMNLGQLAHSPGAYLVDAIGYNQVRGLPFRRRAGEMLKV